MPKSIKDDDSFLGRWSRNKRAQPVEDDVDQPDSVPEPEVAEEESHDEDLIASLPALDDLTPQTDIRVFLQKGVPKALRNAALRRKWMLVPGIRDHKDPAVDYAWDWNTPGGVPGDGLAPSPERTAEMLRDLMMPRRDAAITQADETEADADDPAVHKTADVAAQHKDLPQEQPVAVRLESRPPAGNEADIAQSPMPDPDDGTPLVRRRHGGALPS